ncbi:cytidine deaminase [Arthrobacter crystallopoietes]|uniref:cytidine deaminase n=2 Tax=Crystallibacter crystallopoietes TaxID=37928 RepID=UPI003211CC4C
MTKMPANTTNDGGTSPNDGGSPQADRAKAGRAHADRAEVDWAGLQDAARAASAHAYVPYSKYPVGAAALTEDGRIVSGANVENASYGLTLCAECSLVSALHMSGGGRLVAFSCVDGAGNILMPCGRCRQLLHEFRAPGMQLMTVSGIKSMEEVLPDAFGPENLG